MEEEVSSLQKRRRTKTLNFPKREKQECVKLQENVKETKKKARNRQENWNHRNNSSSENKKKIERMQ